MQVGATAIGTLLVTALVMYGKWQSTEVDLAVALANISKLEKVNEVNASTIVTLLEMSERTVSLLENLGETNAKIQEKSEAKLNEIRQLRSTELDAARLAPFSRGNASHDRVTASLLRIGNANRGEVHTDNARPSSP
jgi:hypothetical protein